MKTKPSNRNRILLVYATWQGSSKEISTRICQVMNSDRLTVECVDVKSMPDPSAYNAVILGGGIRGGCFHPDLIRFVRDFRDQLAKLPVACFIVCLTMSENSEANRCAASEFLHVLKQKIPGFDPVSVGLFGGAMDYSSFSPLMRLMVKMMKMPQGDYRDWDAIEKWALRTGETLQALVKT